MGEVKGINIKNRTYYFFDDIIDIRNFHSNLSKIDKALHEGIDITIKKFIDCQNIHSVNPLYLIIPSATEHFKEKNGEKYLVIDSTDKYQEVFSGITSEIKTLNSEKEIMKKIMQEMELVQMMIHL